MANYRVTLKLSAEKELLDLPNKDCARITEKLKKLSEIPLPVGSRNWRAIRIVTESDRAIIGFSIAWIIPHGKCSYLRLAIGAKSIGSKQTNF